jgi:hypothetical protein
LAPALFYTCHRPRLLQDSNAVSASDLALELEIDDLLALLG